MTQPELFGLKVMLDADILAALPNHWTNREIVTGNCPRCNTTHQQLKADEQ